MAEEPKKVEEVVTPEPAPQPDSATGKPAAEPERKKEEAKPESIIDAAKGAIEDVAAAGIKATVDALQGKLDKIEKKLSDRSDESDPSDQSAAMKAELAAAKAELAKQRALGESGAALLPAYRDRVVASEDAAAVKASIDEQLATQKADVEKLGLKPPAIGGGGNGAGGEVTPAIPEGLTPSQLIERGLKKRK